MTKYLTPEFVIEINERSGGAGAGLIDRGGVEGAVMRCQQSAFGEDAFPTIWLKAGALLHALSSTQYFADGNKRTAWLSAEYFLQINGIDLGDIPDVQADVFVRAIAVDGTLGVETAAEWFRVTANIRRAGPTVDARFEYSLLAEVAACTDDGVVLIQHGHLSGLICSEFPASATIYFVTRYHPRMEDAGAPRHLVFDIAQPESLVMAKDPIENWTLTLPPPAVTGHPNHPGGIMPVVVVQPLPILLIGEGHTFITVSMDGEIVSRHPFTISLEPEMDDLPN